MRAAFIASQAWIYGLAPGAHSRINCIYMVTYFMGGALGSAAGSFAWHQWGWAGVCLVGTGLAATALALRRGVG